MTAMPRWLTLTLISVATLVAIGILWAVGSAATVCDGYSVHTDQIWPGPQPCPVGGAEGPALVTSGVMLALLSAVYVVSFTLTRWRERVAWIIGGAMLLVFAVGLAATVALANVSPPVIYY